MLDAWGNATCPTPDLPTHLELEGPVLAPACSRLDVDSSGRATVQGVRVVAPGADYIGAQQVWCRFVWQCFQAALCGHEGCFRRDLRDSFSGLLLAGCTVEHPMQPARLRRPCRS
mgnify:CR=1 FL=1